MALPLSPGTIYHIRKLLRQNLDRLRFVGINGNGIGIAADGTSDLDQVVESLYPSLGRKIEAIQEFDRLTLVHQALSTSAVTNRVEIEKAEMAIFALLGFKTFDPTGKGQVLVVDDVPINLNLLSNALRHQGYQVEVASSGADAIAMVQANPPDVILLDIMMPEMDGYAVCTQLKQMERLQDIPIVFISAVDDAMSKVRAFSTGGADYVTKPFQLEEVIARVEHQLKLRQLQQRLEAQTSRLQQEVKIRQQAEARYRGLFDNALEPMFQADINGRFLAVNASFARLYGYGEPHRMLELISDIGIQLYADPKRLNELQRQLQQAGQVIGGESQIRRYDGSLIWVAENIRAVKNDRGVIVYYEGTVQDITAVKMLSGSAL
jgi:PAS domain S-box-containing protein